jgi:hypothetical protein
MRSRAGQVVVATGGYAADRSAHSILAEQRPDLLRLPTTNGRWATGGTTRRQSPRVDFATLLVSCAEFGFV